MTSVDYLIMSTMIVLTMIAGVHSTVSGHLHVFDMRPTTAAPEAAHLVLLLLCRPKKTFQPQQFRGVGARDGGQHPVENVFDFGMEATVAGGDLVEEESFRCWGRAVLRRRICRRRQLIPRSVRGPPPRRRTFPRPDSGGEGRHAAPQPRNAASVRRGGRMFDQGVGRRTMGPININSCI